MKCQKCGNNIANTHIKSIVNGEIKEFDLCSACAKKMGYTNVFTDMENEFSNFLGSFFANALPAKTQTTRCEFCGSTYSDITKTGYVGCANCYDVFSEELTPLIRRIHGNTTHCGKNSGKVNKISIIETKNDKIAKLKKELDQAIKVQDFERAAVLRDEIKSLEA